MIAPLLATLHITPLGVLAIAAAGFAAGTINAIVGSGSLVTFPTLVALGLSPLVANVSNNIGLVLGNVSAVHGYRRELVGQAPRMRKLIPWSAAGGITGATLLLVIPGTFHDVVPWLVILAVCMVLIQPRVAKALAARGPRAESGGLALRLGVFLAGVYGGYFGAAQGVILIALLAINLDDHLQRLNGLKNVLAAVVNALAGVLFIIFAPVDYEVALIIAITSVLGGQVGASVGRRLPAPVLRGIIVVGGLTVAIKLLVG
ncbi:MAG TPA: sulfite exporter TauE/SafE family protein [Acidimicrobiales bacterium]|nr:sulfite exporter TauE/SafE family protein [Acidimicrobiales bacterium]